MSRKPEGFTRLFLFELAPLRPAAIIPERMVKEFDLDAPTLSKEGRHAFRNQTRCVTALYERLFVPFGVKHKGWKVLIEVVPRKWASHVRDLLGVLTLQLEGDPLEFLKMDEGGKMRMALEWINRGSQNVAEELGWPTQPFKNAAQAVLERKFVNKWVWKRNLRNMSRTVRCDVEIHHQVDVARIAACFYSRDQRYLGSVEFCSASPNEFAFVPLLGAAEWIDEQTVELTSKSGGERWRAAVPDSAGS